MKKLFTIALSLSMVGTSIPAIHAQETTTKSAIDEMTVNTQDANYEMIQLTKEQKEILNREQEIFINTGLVKEFTLNNEGYLTSSKNYDSLQTQYGLTNKDMKFVQTLVETYNNAAKLGQSRIMTRMQFKNFRVYLSYNETKSYLGTAVYAGPVATAAALAAICMACSGPAAIVTGAIAVLGTSRVITVTKSALAKKHGVWLGWGGIGIN